MRQQVATPGNKLPTLIERRLNAMARRAPRSWGRIKQLPSGRWRASYLAPTDGAELSAKTGSGSALTFTSRGDASAWLSKVEASISAGTWTDPRAPKAAPAETFKAYADRWLTERRLPRTGELLAIRTREGYAEKLRLHINPTFGQMTLREVTTEAVRTWHNRPLPVVGKKTGATARAHSYALLKSILKTATEDDLISANPCTIKAGGSALTQKEIKPLTRAELDALVAAMEPKSLAAAPLLLSWCSLRFGELVGLRREDLDLEARVVHVRRGVVRTKGEGKVTKDPKSRAGKRSVAIPSAVVPALRAHLDEHVGPEPSAPVFTGAYGGLLAASTFGRVFGKAAKAAGRPDVTPHGCRHTGQTMAARAGASLPELMARAGQSTPQAALRYLHSDEDRQREIAERMAAAS